MQSMYRVEEFRAPGTWVPFADVVGLSTAMCVLEELLLGAAGVRVVRGDGVAIVTVYPEAPALHMDDVAACLESTPPVSETRPVRA